MIDSAMPNVIGLPEGTLVHQIPVPGMKMPVPDVRFSELIPPDVASVLRGHWGVQHDDRLILFHRLRDVFVSGEGLIFDRDLNLISQSVAQNDAALVGTAFESLREGVKRATVPSHLGTTLLCGKIGMSNYGHWMVEMLPMAYISREWIASGLWRVFLPRIYPWMKNPILESLDLLSVPQDRIIQNDGSPCHFEELVFISGLTSHGHFYLPVCVECMDEIGRAIPPADAPLIWMSRKGERRSVQCEDAVCDALEARGWRIVEPGRLTLREQIAVSKGARHIAGVSGAGLTNIGFMAPAGRVTLFTPSRMPDIFYWQLSVHRNVEFRDVRCWEILDPAWHIPWDGRLAITVEDVLSQLEA